MYNVTIWFSSKYQETLFKCQCFYRFSYHALWVWPRRRLSPPCWWRDKCKCSCHPHWHCQPSCCPGPPARTGSEGSCNHTRTPLTNGHHWPTGTTDQHAPLTNGHHWPTCTTDQWAPLTNMHHWPTGTTDQLAPLTNGHHWPTGTTDQCAPLTNGHHWPTCTTDHRAPLTNGHHWPMDTTDTRAPQLIPGGSLSGMFRSDMIIPSYEE